MFLHSRRTRLGVAATAAVFALAAASAYCYDVVARHDAEMRRDQAELRRLQELSKIENQQQHFWREQGVERSDLVGVSDTIAYDRAFARIRDRSSGWRNLSLAQLDPSLAEAYECLASAASDATTQRCLEFLPRMTTEISNARDAAPSEVEAIQRRWMRACRTRCTEDFERLAAELVPASPADRR